MGDDEMKNPNTFIAPGDRVRAKVRIEDSGLILAEPGDEGVCVGKGTPVRFWPIVKFVRTGVVAEVSHEKVEKI